MKISVIIPYYNQGDYIQETVESVLCQTHTDFEIIIVNDGSTDSNSISILNEVGKLDNVSVISIENSGPSKARNVAIKASKGELILPLDADDLIADTFLEKAHNAFVNDPNLSVVYSRVEFFGSRKGEKELAEWGFEPMLLKNATVCSIVYKKLCWEEVGGYNKNMVWGYEDWDFALSLAERKYKIFLLDEVMFFYRIKPLSRNANVASSIDRKVTMHMQMLKNHPNYIEHIDVLLEKLLKSYYTKPSGKDIIKKAINRFINKLIPGVK